MQLMVRRGVATALSALWMTCALATVSSTAAAQGSSDQAAAEALFDAGRRLLAEGKTKDACPKLEESLKIEVTGPTLFLLAECLEKDGRFASAWARWKEAAELAKKRGKADKEQEALTHVRTIVPMVSKVRVDVSPSVASLKDLVVKRNDATLGPGAFGVDLPVDPGEISIEVSAPSKLPFKEKRTLTAGKLVVFEVKQLKDAPVGAAPPAPQAPAAAEPSHASTDAPVVLPDPGSKQRIIGYAVGAVGLVGIAIGALSLSSASSKNSTISAKDDRGECQNNGCKDLVSARNSQATYGYLGLIGGGAAFAGGLVLVITAPSTPANVAISPRPMGLDIVGSF